MTIKWANRTRHGVPSEKCSHQARILTNMSIRKGNETGQRSSHKLNQNNFKEIEATMQNTTEKSCNTDTGMPILWDGKQKGHLPIWSQWSKYPSQMGKAEEKLGKWTDSTDYPSYPRSWVVQAKKESVTIQRGTANGKKSSEDYSSAQRGGIQIVEEFALNRCGGWGSANRSNQAMEVRDTDSWTTDRTRNHYHRFAFHVLLHGGNREHC